MENGRSSSGCRICVATRQKAFDVKAVGLLQNIEAPQPNEENLVEGDKDLKVSL